MERHDMLAGVFLLALAIANNFLTETLSCSLQKLLWESQLAKNVTIFVIIYFTIGISRKQSPREKLWKSGAIYLFYLMFTKMHLVPTILVLSLLLAIYFIDDYSEYHEEPWGKEVSDTMTWATMAITAMAFLYYFLEKWREYGKRFSPVTFIFGRPKCKSFQK